ncbi:MAG TPA: hypothetical protein VK172_14875 [Lentimicrobium sp.]|nr:hypothetical protein [Bacteroidales bacterium]HLO92446.1 hypothetical protein [Lentimicrobium sp.]
MKPILILFCCLVISLASSAQNAGKILLFDAATVTGSATKCIPLKSEDMGFMQVVFTSLDCDTSLIKVGYGLTDTVVTYPSTLSGLSNPIVLNKLATDPYDSGQLFFSHTVSGRTNCAFGIMVPQWRPYYLTFEYRKACNHGKIYLIYKK